MGREEGVRECLCEPARGVEVGGAMPTSTPKYAPHRYALIGKQ